MVCQGIVMNIMIAIHMGINCIAEATTLHHNQIHMTNTNIHMVARGLIWNHTVMICVLNLISPLQALRNFVRMPALQIMNMMN